MSGLARASWIEIKSIKYLFFDEIVGARESLVDRNNTKIANAFRMKAVGARKSLVDRNGYTVTNKKPIKVGARESLVDRNIKCLIHCANQSSVGARESLVDRNHVLSAGFIGTPWSGLARAF